MVTQLAPTAQPRDAWPGQRSGVGPPYALLLEDAPDHLVPAALSDQLHVDLDRQVRGSTWCQLEGMSGPPPGVTPPSVVHHDAWTAWVRHPGHGACLPYLLDRQSVLAVESAADEWPISRPLDARRRWALVAAGVLTQRGRAAAACTAWGRTASQCHREFAAAGFTNIPALLEPLHAGRLRRYYRTLVRNSGRGGLQLGDEQASNRYVAYDEPVARFFHAQLAQAVSHVAGRPVKPSFCYSAAYVEGPELPRHIDRPGCEYTLALHLDAWPEPNPTSASPLVLDLPTGQQLVYQALGDGVLFRGREIPHGRPALPARHFAVSLLLHYVDMDVDGPLA